MQPWIQEPQAEIHRKQAHSDNQEPLTDLKNLADKKPDQCESCGVERKMRTAKMNEMAADKPPKFAGSNSSTVLAQIRGCRFATQLADQGQ
mgnify:CR=1 FL=1